jgi:hypothetical protein
MTVNKPNRAQRMHNSGYEPGSLMSQMSRARRKAYEDWKKQKDRDGRAFERGLGAKDEAFQGQ